MVIAITERIWDFDTWSLVLYASPFSRVFIYVLGIVAGMCYEIIEKENTTFKYSNLFQIIMFILCVLAYFWGIKRSPADPYVNLIYVPLFITTIIVLSLSGQQGRIGRFLSCRINLWLGGISMYIYLLHWPIVVYGGDALVRVFGVSDFRLMAYAVLLFIFTMIVAAGINIIVNKRIRAYNG